MRYISTRGAAPAVGFIDALLNGLAPDGGLYLPAEWPRVTRGEIAAFAGAPYACVAADIVGRFLGDEIAAPDLQRLCEQAYAAFDHPAVTPLTQLAPGRFLLELFRGPTLAFKDVAMRLLAQLYDHALAACDRRLTIVCATSGDTGGAAAAAFAGHERTRLVILYPEGRVSEVQRRFMTTAGAVNVRAVAVAGDFDDCQAIVKALFADRQFATCVGLTGVNSINFARIAAQCVYYFAAAAALGAPDRACRFVVPSGNFGDAYAGWAARAMGLPIAGLLAATNANDILARALDEGVYRRGPALATRSPAMDIQVASNFERLYFDCVDRDGGATAEAFADFGAAGSLTIPAGVLARMRAVFSARSVDEARTVSAITANWRETGILVDPHTAVAIAADDRARWAGDPTTPTVILATAHPAKFPEAVRAATGVAPRTPPKAVTLAGLPESIDRLPANTAAVKSYIQEFADA